MQVSHAEDPLAALANTAVYRIKSIIANVAFGADTRFGEDRNVAAHGPSLVVSLNRARQATQCFLIPMYDASRTQTLPK